jgi:hypothetical protein
MHTYIHTCIHSYIIYIYILEQHNNAKTPVSRNNHGERARGGEREIERVKAGGTCGACHAHERRKTMNISSSDRIKTRIKKRKILSCVQNI